MSGLAAHRSSPSESVTPASLLSSSETKDPGVA